MKTIELFSGTGSFSKVAKELGHTTFKVDNDKSFEADLYHDLLEPFPDILCDKIKEADIIWLSPPCQTFSMASGNKHWSEDRQPKTEAAKIGHGLLMNCKRLAEYCIKHNKIFFIENPVARARWFMPKEWEKTVWYCQYGDTRAKPTNIWTNLKEWNGKTCKNYKYDKITGEIIGKHCHHESARRGSITGTQGIKGAKKRGIIPSALFEEIFRFL